LVLWYPETAQQRLGLDGYRRAETSTCIDVELRAGANQTSVTFAELATGEAAMDRDLSFKLFTSTSDDDTARL
jgi:hypothetical protein